MKRLVANTKFQSTNDLIYVGPVSDYESYAFGYGHRIDSYSDEFQNAVIEIVNKQKKERNRKGLDLKGYTNDADVVINDILNPHNHSYFPQMVLEYADTFNGEYYIDYTDLYSLIEADMLTGISGGIKNMSKLIKSSPYYIAEDKDGQFNLMSNQGVLDLIDADSAANSVEYVNHNIEYEDPLNGLRFTFYPVDQASAMKMKQVIDGLVWTQDITDYILSQEEILWRE